MNFEKKTKEKKSNSKSSLVYILIVNKRSNTKHEMHYRPEKRKPWLNLSIFHTTTTASEAHGTWQNNVIESTYFWAADRCCFTLDPT